MYLFGFIPVLSIPFFLLAGAFIIPEEKYREKKLGSILRILAGTALTLGLWFIFSSPHFVESCVIRDQKGWIQALIYFVVHFDTLLFLPWSLLAFAAVTLNSKDFNKLLKN